MKRLAGIYASEYLEGIKRAGINPWTGRSFNQLRSQVTNPLRVSIRSWGVVVPGNLISLDSTPSRFVSLKPGRSITRWAKTKRGQTGGAVFVRRHPWINQSHRSARSKIRVIRDELVKTARKISR